MSKTNIPYCDEACNCVVGCTPCSPACDNCWSKKLHDMRHRAYCDYKAFFECTENPIPRQYAKPFSKIQLFPERLEELKHLRKPRTIFMCSGSDLFHEEVPDEFIDKVFEVMISHSQHAYLILTKRVKRLAKWLQDFKSGKRIPHRFFADRVSLPDKIITHPSGFPPYKLPDNIILGISIWDQESADRDIPILLECWKGKKWLSIEPMLGKINLRKYLTKVQVDKQTSGNNKGDIRNGGIYSKGTGEQIQSCIPNNFYNSSGEKQGKTTGDMCGLHLSQTTQLTSERQRSISFCVIGCESGRNRRPCKDEWINSIAGQCVTAGIPFLIKQREMDGKVVACKPCKDFFTKGGE